MNVAAVLEHVRDALEAARIPYFVTGSYVSSAHGIPRSTNDVDVVIAPTPEELRILLEHFRHPQYYAEPEDALQALQHRSQFNVIDNTTLLETSSSATTRPSIIRASPAGSGSTSPVSTSTRPRPKTS